MERIVRASVADLLINLSAGWIGTAYGVFFLAETDTLLKIELLTVDIGFATLCLVSAIWLRRRLKK